MARPKGPPCKVEGCGKPHMARGWCATHYQRWKVHGSVEDRPREHDLGVRLKRNMEITGSGCWMWTGFIDGNGYAVIKIKRHRRQAHRVAYVVFRGVSVPEGMELDHLCRNRACINPDHLEPVTSAQNVQRGLAAKLTPREVREIRSLRAGGCTNGEIAKAFGVGPKTVSSIFNGHSWVGV